MPEGDGRKRIFNENNAADSAAQNQANGPFNGLAGAYLGKKPAFPERPPDIVGDNITGKGNDENIKNP